MVDALVCSRILKSGRAARSRMYPCMKFSLARQLAVKPARMLSVRAEVARRERAWVQLLHAMPC